jgi:hypothetical protein
MSLEQGKNGKLEISDRHPLSHLGTMKVSVGLSWQEDAEYTKMSSTSEVCSYFLEEKSPETSTFI